MRMLSLLSTVLVAGSVCCQEKLDSLSEDIYPPDADALETLVENSSGDENSPLVDIISDQKSALEGVVEIRSRVGEDVQVSRGFSEHDYLGSPLRSLQRIRISRYNNISTAIVMEKDPGEQTVDDFLAGYFQMTSIGPVSSVVLGDYVVEAGQGVALWRGFETRKGGDAIVPARRIGRDVVPYASSGESSFLRGAAATVTFGDISSILFASSMSIPGSLDADGNVASLYTSGLFRTQTEMSKRDAFLEKLVGGRIKFRGGDSSTCGVTVVRSGFSRKLSLSNGFTGSRSVAAALDYDMSMAGLNTFGEWCFSTSAGPAGLSGVLIHPDEAVELVAAYRNYPAQTPGIHGNPFADGPSGANERGMYQGIQYRAAPGLTVNAYADVFQSVAPAATTLYRVTGVEYSCEFMTNPVRRLHATVRVSYRSGASAGAEGGFVRPDDRLERKALRINLEYRDSPDVLLRNRFEVHRLRTEIAGGDETGILFYQGIAVRVSPKLNIEARVVLFTSDSYDSGIGEFENDIPGQLTVPVLYGRGVRWYFLQSLALMHGVVLSFKYSELIRDDVRRIGSGFDELPGNIDSRVALQIDVTK